MQEKAGYNKVLDTVKFAAEKAGVIAHVNTHALRRGFFRDVAHLPKAKLDGAPSMAVATAGGHSFAAFGTGTTTSYIGGMGADIHNARVAASKRSNDARRIMFDTEQPYKKTKISKEVVDQKCEEMGLGNTKVARNRARRVIEASRKAAWVQGGTAAAGEN